MVNYTVSKFHTCTRLKKFVGNRNIREVLQEQREVLQLTSINGTCMRKLTTRKCHTYWLLTTAVHSKVASALRGCLCVLISLFMSVMRAETVDSSAVVPRTGEEAGGCIDLTGNHGDECALHAARQNIVCQWERIIFCCSYAHGIHHSLIAVLIEIFTSRK